MRFLKKKISLKPDFLEKDNHFDTRIQVQNDNYSSKDLDFESTDITSVRELILPLRRPRQHPPSPDGNSKNIVKNYGRALCSFASCKISLTYLEKIVIQNNLDLASIPNFVKYIKSKRRTISSIESVRRLLVGEKDDDVEILAYKKIFKEASIIFLKFFAVNWIFGGKLLHKKAHLNFRFKMLRRVQNPEQFTYLKSSAT